MTEIFLKLVNMSISASWLVLIVLVLRLILKKAPKWISVLLWGIVAVRLICPFSIESAFSLMPSAEIIPTNILTETNYEADTGIVPIDNQVNEYIGEHYFEGVTVPVNAGYDFVSIATIIWIGGCVVLAVYIIISYVRLKSQLDTAVLIEGRIYRSEKVNSSFVLGVMQPKIYVPFQLNGQQLNYVIAHEQAHITRRDHWWKLFGFTLLSIHWFNPLVWVSYLLFCKDMELACDERVIQNFDKAQKADYSQALLSCSVNNKMMIASPLFFGEIGVKERVKTVLNYKKPGFWIVIVSVIICGIVAVCFLTNPESKGEQNIVSSNETDNDFMVMVDNILIEIEKESLDKLSPIVQMFEEDKIAFLKTIAQLDAQEVLEVVSILVTGKSDIELEEMKEELYSLQSIYKGWGGTEIVSSIDIVLAAIDVAVPNESFMKLIMERITRDKGFYLEDDAKKYEETIENITEDAVVLLCQSESKKYTVYGFISPEYGKLGIMIDYVMDDNSSFLKFLGPYTWAYSETIPSVTEVGEHEGVLRFTQGDGTESELRFEVNETGQIEIVE